VAAHGFLRYNSVMTAVTDVAENSDRHVAMKTILLPFFDDEASQTALGTAHLIAARFNGHIEGLFVEEIPQVIGGEGISLPAEYLTQLESERRHRANHARGRFVAYLEAKGTKVAGLGEPGDGVTGGWHEEDGQESHIVGELGRLFELIVVGRTLKHGAGGWEFTCEAALFESGRPVLLAAETVPEAIGKQVVIAWNGSTETARTVAFAMPFLKAAERVVVLTVRGQTVPGPNGESVAEYLRRSDVDAYPVTVETLGRQTGEAILDETRMIGADLLVKGAYTQNRLRQMIFGGATRHILSHADLPVFMAH
jgi:nucleotide-binding universal stress UspA family protein